MVKGQSKETNRMSDWNPAVDDTIMHLARIHAFVPSSLGGTRLANYQPPFWTTAALALHPQHSPTSIVTYGRKK
ncbi:unnamed protein product [Clonostachys solani]|uniref:Uncharacterized protein n=1 Tax=Clonostachys solani TaxID=160281 RepID=A0A9N9ZH63_9HYPO|nr:unnamed protein product [Clonostachys solani]